MHTALSPENLARPERLAKAGLARNGWDLARLADTTFALHSSQASSRPAVEDCIRAQFAQCHGAQITHFLPELISLGCQTRICGAVGLSPAARSRLFAESYLDTSVEFAIAAASGQAVMRRDVLEIGNLVSRWKGSSLLLFVFLSELIERLGFRWAVFTATPEVERLLAKLKFSPAVLGQAKPERLADAGASWGSYYQRAPRVMYGEIAPAVALARQGLMYRGVAKMIAPQVSLIASQLQERCA